MPAKQAKALKFPKPSKNVPIPVKKNGRPTKYKEEYNEAIIKWFSIPPYREIDIPHMGPTGEFKWLDHKRVANSIPKFHEFCDSIDISSETLSSWAKPENKDKYPGFLEAYTRAKDLQKWFLIENGMNGLYNPAFAIFVSKNITDMKDKHDTDITSKGEKIQFEIVQASTAPKEE